VNKYQQRRDKLPADTWRQELKEIISGASGGFLFGIPLLYTMEVWFIGSYVQPPILLTVLGVTSVVILSLNRIEGFRPQESETIADAIAETIETLAIGITCATVMLIILRRIDFQTSLIETLGTIIFEAVPFSFGVAFSRSLLTGNSAVNLDERNPRKSPINSKNKLVWRDTLADCAASFIGAVFIAFSIAPTDEVVLLAASTSPFWLLMLIVASLVVSYCIVFAAEFTNFSQRRKQQGLFQTPQAETVISYLIALIASASILWFFQQLSLEDPWFIWLRYTVILSFPASIGGAAGRLAV
jgi:putative integral membrane protein (TIGR02587 family)